MRKWFIVLLISSLLGIFALLYGCSSPPFAQVNYDECRKILEESRQEAKRKEAYSYSHEAYQECRRPAYFRQPDPDEED